MKRHEEAFEDANEALSIRPKYMNAYIAKATAQGSIKCGKMPLRRMQLVEHTFQNLKSFTNCNYCSKKK